MRHPLRIAYETFAYVVSLAMLALLSLGWSAIAGLLHPLLTRHAGTIVGRRGIHLGFRLYGGILTALGAYRFDLEEIDALRDAAPMILAPNHPSLIDAPMILSRHPNVACVMKSNVRRNPLFGGGARLARYVTNDSPRRMIRESIDTLRGGGLLLLFPEGTRTVRSPIGSLGAGVGAIAKRANVPVQTLLIETDSPFLGKTWRLPDRPRLPVTYRIKLGKRFAPPEDPGRFTEHLEAYFRATLAPAPGASSV